MELWVLLSVDWAWQRAGAVNRIVSSRIIVSFDEAFIPLIIPWTIVV